MKAIILGAGRGIRRLKSEDSYPMSLVEDERGQKVLDWILAALESNGIEDINFVGGYHVEKLIQSYSKLRYFYNHILSTGFIPRQNITFSLVVKNKFIK